MNTLVSFIAWAKALYFRLKALYFRLKAKEEPAFRAAKRFGYWVSGFSLVAITLIAQVDLEVPAEFLTYLKYTAVIGGTIAGTAKLSVSEENKD